MSKNAAIISPIPARTRKRSPIRPSHPCVTGPRAMASANDPSPHAANINYIKYVKTTETSSETCLRLRSAGRRRTEDARAGARRRASALLGATDRECDHRGHREGREGVAVDDLRDVRVARRHPAGPHG